MKRCASYISPEPTCGYLKIPNPNTPMIEGLFNDVVILALDLILRWTDWKACSLVSRSWFYAIQEESDGLFNKKAILETQAKLIELVMNGELSFFKAEEWGGDIEKAIQIRNLPENSFFLLHHSIQEAQLDEVTRLITSRHPFNWVYEKKLLDSHFTCEKPVLGSASLFFYKLQDGHEIKFADELQPFLDVILQIRSKENQLKAFQYIISTISPNDIKEFQIIWFDKILNAIQLI